MYSEKNIIDRRWSVCDVQKMCELWKQNAWRYPCIMYAWNTL